MIKAIAAALLLAAPAAATSVPPLLDGPQVWKQWREGRTPLMYELLGFWKLEGTVRSDSVAPKLQNGEEMTITWKDYPAKDVVVTDKGVIGVAVRGRVTLGAMDCKMSEDFELICARFMPAGLYRSEMERALSGETSYRLLDRHHVLMVFRRPYRP